MRRRLKWLAFALVPLVTACSSTMGLLKKGGLSAPTSKKSVKVVDKDTPGRNEQEGAFHIVGKGESLSRICDVYGLDFAKVAKINGLKAPYVLKEGDTVFLPAQALLSESELAKRNCRKKIQLCSLRKGGSTKVAHAIRGNKHPSVPWLKFPVDGGELSSPFGYRWGKFHKGLDIAAPRGRAVRACAAGRVMFTGSRKRFRRYGNTVLIHHREGVYTYYAHLSKILVKRNQSVKQGQVIGRIGNTGRSTGPHLHLEVRVGNMMYNPLAYFSPRALAGVRVAKRFTDSPMGPVRARWRVPELLAARR